MLRRRLKQIPEEQALRRAAATLKIAPENGENFGSDEEHRVAAQMSIASRLSCSLLSGIYSSSFPEQRAGSILVLPVEN